MIKSRSEPIDYDAEYDNRGRVPEHPGIMVRWAKDAAAFRAAMAAEGRISEGLQYGPHARHRLDLIDAEDDRNGPMALFLHGGYWQDLGRESFSHLAAGPAAHGIPVAIMSYRLCPEVRIDEIIADARAAVAWLGARYGRAVLPIGHSAGGHLAACLLATDWGEQNRDLHHGLVPAAVAFSGLFDLEPLTSTRVNDKLGLSHAEANAASPLAWPAPQGRWLEAFVGETESSEYHHQTESIVRVWGTHGTSAKMRVVPDANHFTVIDGLTDPDSDTTVRIAMLSHSLE